jgi:glycosyltransferase involved in cell wall biosynthesis
VQVARVIAKLEPGGAQLGALRLSAALRDQGVETRLLAGHASRGGVALCRAHGLDVEVWGGCGAELQYACRPDFVAWLRPRLAGTDVVHGHMFGAWWAAAQAAPDDLAVVASEHNALRWPGRPELRRMRRALARVDAFFAHGPAAAELVLSLGLPAGRLREGRSPLAGSDAREGRRLAHPRVVFAGRLEHEKGPDLLIESLALTRTRPAAYLLGAGPLDRALRRRARALCVPARFPGWQHQPGRWIAGAAACVVPSRHDASTQTGLLAMALGTPVVGTAVEGLPAVLGDGRAVIVPPEDPAALAAALDALLEGRMRTDVEAGRRYASQFTADRVAAIYAAEYRRLAAVQVAEPLAPAV